MTNPTLELMKVHSDKAWKIASWFSNVLASDTRTLAGMIDAEYPPDANTRPTPEPQGFDKWFKDFLPRPIGISDPIWKDHVQTLRAAYNAGAAAAVQALLDDMGENK